MDYAYGTRTDEIDEFFRAKRVWSKVKDEVVGNYITCYLKTVQRRGRPIIIVDAFAGPGLFGDDSPGSPLIICNAIRATAKGQVGIGCLFADAHPGHRAALEQALGEHIKSGVCEKPYAECAEALNHAVEIGTDATIFFYLDPYGIKDLDFEMVRQIYERDTSQSTEVLINFNFRAFMRMSGNWGYGATADEIALKVKSSKIETVNRVMDGDYWRSIITDPSLDKIGREDKVVSAYVERIKRYFRYTFAIPVKQRDETDYNVPTDELARYHLIFGTRHYRAVEFMNDVALNALQPYFDQFKDGLLFDMTPERYQSASRDKVKAAIVQAVAARPLKRPQIFEAVIPQFFMHYLKKEYRAMIDELTFNEGRLHPDRGTMKKKTQLNDDTLLSASPWPGAIV